MYAVNQGCVPWSTYSWSMAAMLSDVVVVFRPRWVHVPAIHAASHFDHGNRVAWFSIMIFTYTCSSLPIVVVLRLGALPGGRSSAMKQWHYCK